MIARFVADPRDSSSAWIGSSAVNPLQCWDTETGKWIYIFKEFVSVVALEFQYSYALFSDLWCRCTKIKFINWNICIIFTFYLPKGTMFFSSLSLKMKKAKGLWTCSRMSSKQCRHCSLECCTHSIQHQAEVYAFGISRNYYFQRFKVDPRINVVNLNNDIGSSVINHQPDTLSNTQEPYSNLFRLLNRVLVTWDGVGPC